jgi:hypothetical protein
MNYKSKMLSLKRSVVAAALIGSSLAFMAGCKTSKPQPTPAQPPVVTPTVTIPPLISTNTLILPTIPATPPDSSDNMLPNVLVWDAVSKEYQARPGEMIAPFSFSLTNIFPRPVMIYDTQTSCDCTVAKLPSRPWTVQPGGTGKIEASINLTGKVGTVTNYIIVFTSQGNRRLNVKAILPDSK